MSWAVVAVAGASIVSGAMSADAAGDASDAQVGAADRGTAEQRRQFDKVQELLMPFVTAATGPIAASGGPVGETEAQIRARLRAQFPVPAAPSSAAQMPVQGYDGSETNTFGAGLQPEATARIRAARGLPPLQQQSATPGAVDDSAYEAAVQAELARQAQVQQQQASGQIGALPAYLNLTGLNGADAQRAAIAGIEGGPQFGSLARQSEDAILQNASATGGLRGGNTQGALADFRSNLLSSLIDKQLSRYGGIVQLGQGSAAGVGNAAMSTGQGISGLMQQAGAAQAGGIMAGSGAITDAIGGIGGLIAGRGGWQPSTAVPAATGYGGAGISGGGGFGSGVVYGNQDMGQYF